MYHFHLQFAYPWAPWLFLLLIPALGITLFLYFRMNKRYRRTRNRVISIVLHMLVMTLCITVLTGIVFVYDVTNDENEIILVVDVSDTEEQSAEARDDFVAKVIEDCGLDGFKVGVVTFGFTQEYAVPLTYDTEQAIEDYYNATLPDTSATDVAAALRFARTLFTNPQTSKLVLVSDGKETDENAASVITSIIAQGTRMDSVYIPSDFSGDTFRVKEIKLPETHINVGVPCVISVTIESRKEQSVSIELTDNGETLGTAVQELTVGTQAADFNVSFSEDGLHEIGVRVTSQGDTFSENNGYTSYYYLHVYNKVLILEQFEGNSEELEKLLGADGADYETTTVNLQTGEVPKTVDELRAYDQVILNNVANADLPEGFSDILYSYVYDYGGGMLTVGGSDDQGEAHAYDREDLYNTRLQQMLPVQAIDYTPPVGVMVIIDISGSMDSEELGTMSMREWAVEGAHECLRALTDRDYFGIMTLDTTYGTILPLTPCTQQVTIREALESVKELKGGMTMYSQALDMAGQALATLKKVDRRHIILVTDGMPGQGDEEYLPIVDSYYTTNEITVSTVGLGMSEGDSYANCLQKIADTGHGRAHIFNVNNSSTLLSEMRDDLNAKEIKEVIPEPFHPRVETNKQALIQTLLDGVETGIDGEQRHTFSAQLGGFYGVRSRSSADLVLVGDYDVPLYAQWKFGNGMVGSFMSDLNGTWSSEFLGDANARKFLYNAINNLMPTTDIRPGEISVTLNEENYINRLSVYAGLGEGESIRARIEGTGGDSFSLSLNEIAEADDPSRETAYVTAAFGAPTGYSRCSFVLKKSGVYRIVIEKCNAGGEVIASRTLYKSFAYSEEYGDYAREDRELLDGLRGLAEGTGGVLIADNEDPYEIFENFDIYITREFDPRILFISLAMALFLLDIIVRKFRFKWIHEIVRERREKKAQEEKQ